MKIFFTLIPALLISFSVQAQTQTLESDTTDWFSAFESLVQELDDVVGPTRKMVDTTNYQSRWSQRQASYQALSGHRARPQRTENEKSFSLRKSRRTRTNNSHISPQRKQRTTSRSTYGATSNKLRLQTRKNIYRSQLKPPRFKNRQSQSVQNSGLNNENSTLENILEGLEADFEIEIEVDKD